MIRRQMVVDSVGKVTRHEVSFSRCCYSFENKSSFIECFKSTSNIRMEQK